MRSSRERSSPSSPRTGRATRTAVTDASGRFRFEELSPGRFHVRLAAADRTALAVDEDVAAGELTSVTYRLEANRPSNEPAALEFGATATIEAPPREVTKRSLSAGELCEWQGRAAIP